ncbi:MULTISPECIES: ABC transporter permease [unclassified Rathayibacter]|uniref:ABC transporter permease n=1 Tax=unclassified Rathayibacter TaxID=2609250 RepID=UPI000CE8D208|nr:MULTISPECIES: ABC transporter permease [unclassified Rathayibacter]PPH19203.1 peptide ABC transporter permease [Rathayibacter sp. AY1F8]PPH74524.1 peptide ABC transporter permease [Rathayibacter sp. AY1D4]PPH88928.1 peptide ABC transporter permease [Rathayibacter sp. AY1D3]
MSTTTTAVRTPRQRGGRAAHPFLRYALRRVLTSLLLVVGVTLVTFILTNLVSGDPVAAALGQRAAEDPEIVAQFRAQYGLDQPLVVQYFTYLGKLLHGDLGVSTTTHNPVVADLAKALPATLEIAFGAIVLSVIIGVLFGTVAAYRRGRASDHVLRVVSLAGLSVPTFWLALVLYYVLYFQLRIAPGSGRLSSDFTTPPTVTGLYTVDALLAGQLDTFLDAASHLFLPVLVLTLYTVGLLTRFVRTAMLEILDQDYVRAARAKGLPNRAVTFSYVLRGASIPILTVVGLAFGSLLSGTVLVEAVFGWPGIGSYAYQAASHLDLRGIMGVGLLIGVMYLLVNLIVDLLYGVLDPRVRLAS